MSEIVTDGAPELTSGKWKKTIDTYNIKPSITEPHSPWQNHAEGEIREFKKMVRRTMSTTATPLKFWDYCATWASKVQTLTSPPLYSMNGRTGHEIITGETPDISEHIDYGWFDYLWYIDENAAFPEDKQKLGRWMGPSHQTGQALTYFIINSEGNILSRSTVQPLTEEEHINPVVKKTNCQNESINRQQAQQQTTISTSNQCYSMMTKTKLTHYQSMISMA